MLPEIWSATDKVFCHLRPFLPFYPPHNPENQNFEKMKKNSRDIIILHMYTINDVWFLRYGVQQTQFSVILGHFLPFYLTKTLKNQNFKKLKNKPRDFTHFTPVHQK